MSESDFPDAHLRITQTQRENVVGVLRQAAADGRLSFAELSERSAAALAASTRGELAAQLRDLVPSADLPQVVAAGQVFGEGPGMSWDEPLVLRPDTFWRTRAVAGAWHVPPFLEVVGSARSLRLNFIDAVPLAPVLDLTVVLGWFSTLTLVVPEGWGVDTTHLTQDSSASVTCTVPTRPHRGQPRLVVRGRVSGATVTVRTPKPRDAKDRTTLPGFSSQPELTA